MSRSVQVDCRVSWVAAWPESSVKLSPTPATCSKRDYRWEGSRRPERTSVRWDGLRWNTHSLFHFVVFLFLFCSAHVYCSYFTWPFPAVGSMKCCHTGCLLFMVYFLMLRLVVDLLQCWAWGFSVQVRTYRGFLDCVACIAREEGPAAFFKGLSPSLIKAAMSTGFTFFWYEFFCSTISSMRKRRRSWAGTRERSWTQETGRPVAGLNVLNLYISRFTQCVTDLRTENIHLLGSMMTHSKTPLYKKTNHLASYKVRQKYPGHEHLPEIFYHT